MQQGGRKGERKGSGVPWCGAYPINAFGPIYRKLLEGVTARAGCWAEHSWEPRQSARAGRTQENTSSGQGILKPLLFLLAWQPWSFHSLILKTADGCTLQPWCSGVHLLYAPLAKLGHPSLQKALLRGTEDILAQKFTLNALHVGKVRNEAVCRKQLRGMTSQIKSRQKVLPVPKAWK